MKMLMDETFLIGKKVGKSRTAFDAFIFPRNKILPYIFQQSYLLSGVPISMPLSCEI